jgi:hypothetical protein
MYQIAMFFLHFDFRKTLYNFFDLLSFRTKPNLELKTEINNMEEGSSIGETIER